MKPTKLPTNEQLKFALISLGLTEHGAAVYLATLTLGSATVSQIARTANIKRTTTYTVLEALSEDGYVSRVARGTRLKYSASHPEILSNIVTSKLESFNKLLPDLAALYNLGGSTGITRIFEGIKSSKGVYELLLKNARPGDPYMILSDMDKGWKLFGEFWLDFAKRRAKLGLKPQHILADTKMARSWIENIIRLGATGKILPKHINCSINLVIIPKMVVIHQLVPPVHAVVIESPLISDMLRQMYQIIWDTIPEFSRKK